MAPLPVDKTSQMEKSKDGEYEGSVVVYAIEGCPHCIAAKATLRKIPVPCQEILVDKHSPDLRKWLKDRTHKSSVPQIFFNETHIGGKAELNELIKDEDRLFDLVKDVRENPLPSHGEAGLYLPSRGSKASISKYFGEGGLHEFSCEPDEYASLVEDIKHSEILGSHKKGGLFSENVKNSFTGEELVSWLKRSKEVTSSEAKNIGKELLARKFILKVKYEDDVNFVEDGHVLYRIQVGFDPHFPLNCLRGQTSTCVQGSAEEIAGEMGNIILSLYSEYISEDGSKVDYAGIKTSKTFISFKKLGIELQRLDLSGLNVDQKLSFFINIYNALVIHGSIERGIPTNTWQRYKFFSTTGYNIGGYFYSLNDIENGVLRANRGSAATLFRIPFSSKHDPRRSTSLPQVDPRIHFALNCGAKSCPPIKTFTSSNIDEELAAATESFLESDEALRVTGSEIHVSMLFKWYQIDFGKDKKEMLEWIDRNTSNKELTQLLHSGTYKVRYIDYNWGNNAKTDK